MQAGRSRIKEGKVIEFDKYNGTIATPTGKEYLFLHKDNESKGEIKVGDSVTFWADEQMINDVEICLARYVKKR